jgi:hypothetical protein
MKLLGSVAQACPNCGASLGKMPARKTKCKDCGLFMYVRTRPQDRVQVLLTEEDAQALEAQWHQYEDDKPQISPRSEHALAQVRDALHEQFGRSPSEPDVLWRVFNEELLGFIGSESWALYTHVLFEMAELQLMQGRRSAALDLYVQAVHLALNGPRNIDRELVRAGYPRFLPTGFIPERYIQRLVKAQRALGLSRKQVEVIYLATATRLSTELVLPLAAETTWNTLAAHIAHDA